jgi:hypothetical protein
MMQNIISSFQQFFTPASKPGDEYVEENSGQAPTLKSLQTGKFRPETCSMSEIGKNSSGARSDQHDSDATPPIYRVGRTWNVEETSQITVDVFLQHIHRDEINSLQSDIEAGFQCDDTYQIGGKSMTPFQYAMWQGNADAMKVLLPHTSRNHIVLAFLEAHEASHQELAKILPAAKKILATLKSQSDWKHPVAQCANFIERIEEKSR